MGVSLESLKPPLPSVHFLCSVLDSVAMPEASYHDIDTMVFYPSGTVSPDHSFFFKLP